MNIFVFYLNLFLIFNTFVLSKSEPSPKIPADPFGTDTTDDDDDDTGSPFDTIVTRAPMTIDERRKEIQQKALEELNKPPPLPQTHRRIRPHGRGRPRGYYRHSVGGALYNIYPILYPKGPDYCPQLRGVFRFTCQPSKSLRLDLVEFCKQYSSFCGVINTHRLPGPGLGPPPDPKSIGHVGVSGNFGFSVGAVPGLEINAGWGVDVGPLPGMGESVGVNVDSGVGILGASPPAKYRKGMDSPKDARGGIVGVSGGVGVNPGAGVGPVGVNGGVGVG